MTRGLVYLWVDGPGVVSLLTSIMMVGKTSSWPTVISQVKEKMTCEAFSGGKLCRLVMLE